MSSTNRGAERIEKDNYPTPAWCVERLLDWVHPPGSFWLEPCVGDGSIVRVLTRKCQTPRMLAGIDVRDVRENAQASGCTNFSQGSYLDLVPMAHWYDAIITNPPYSLAFDIVKKAVNECDWVAMLLPLNFLASSTRAAWFQEHTPSVGVLPDRPNFVRSYKCSGCETKWRQRIEEKRFIYCPQCKSFKIRISESDSIDYGWFLWDTRRHQMPTVRILNVTPKEERRSYERNWK